MAQLDTLPAELLDAIIELVVFREDDAPTDLAAAASTRSESEAFSGIFDTKVITQRIPAHSNSAGLLQTSRFLRAATNAVIERLGRRPNGLPLVLDLLFVHERELWTTWVHVPVIAQRIERLNINIRIADGHVAGKMNGLLGTSGPRAIIYAFHYILHAFVRRGLSLDSPQGCLVDPPRWGDLVNDRHITVRRVTVNISTLNSSSKVLAPPDSHDAWLASRTWESVKDPHPSSDTQELFRSAIRPEWLAEDVLGETYGVPCLLRLDKPQYATLIHERIGTFGLHVDSTLWRSFDVGQAFADLIRVPDGSTTGYPRVSEWFGKFAHCERGPRFVQWWKTTMIRRLELGFPVGDATLEGLKFPAVEVVLLPLPAEAAIAEA